MKTLKSDVINKIAFEVEHIESMLTICKKEDSYIPGTLKATQNFIKELKKLLNI